MDEKEKVRTQLEGELLKCETRIKELRGPAREKGGEKEVEGLASELQGCRIALDGLLKKRADEWQRAKGDVVVRLRNLSKKLDSTARRFI
ncbi:MAG: hypothetical protein FJY74_06990 [Candidatus Eisenbacteria bacterium]|nr:hypothetical protein [Candidatus Eisenbacteria bacterium]